MTRTIATALLVFAVVVRAQLPLAVPGAPTGLSVTVTGQTVALAWSAPSGGDAPTGYIVRASLSPSGAVIATLPLGLQTSVSVPNVPVGTYYVTVAASNASGVGLASNEVQVVVAPMAPPGAPVGLTQSVTGASVTLAWSAPATGGPPASYIVEAGSAPGLANLVVFPHATTVLVATAPDGIYYVRVRAVNAAGTGPVSNEVTVIVGTPCTPPGAPGSLTVSGSGLSITLQWIASSTGGAPTEYVIEAGSQPLASNLVVFGTGNAATQLPATAPAGTYYVRVRARNACGTSAPTADLVLVLPLSTTPTYPTGYRVYAIGSTTLQDIWVDPVNGNDSNTGSTRTNAMRTVEEAWRSIPAGAPLTGTGYRIRLVAGEYSASNTPNFWENRLGTYQFPIIFEAADAPRSAVFRGDVNMFNSSYVYFIGIAIDRLGDAFHCELCDHLLLRNVRLVGGTWPSGGADVAHETLKVNQSQHVYVEDSEIRGAEDNAVDYVGVQYGHLVRSRISDAQDWCGYAKGGSAYLVIEANEFFDCGTGGYTVGQGTGFQFMTSPWLHYEAYDIKVVNNIVHDVEGAGLGVNGGFNILLAWNTLVRVGTRDHVFEAVFGLRSCDGQLTDPGRERCQQYLDALGWGTTVVDNGSNAVRIPNRHVLVYNNVIYNPPGIQSDQIFAIYGPFGGATQVGSNAPNPALTDDDLRIQGNVIFDGPVTHPLGIEGAEQGCQAGNSTCNATQLRAQNEINGLHPTFANVAGNDFRPTGALLTTASVPIPAFTGWDTPPAPAVPAGLLSNAVQFDRGGNPRTAADPPGAHRQ